MDNYSKEEFKITLKNNKLFRLLSDVDLNGIADNAQIISIKKGKHVFTEGSINRGIYFIISGLIKLYNTGAKGRVQIFQFLKSGDIICFDSLLGFLRTSNAAFVIADAELIFIPQKVMTSILVENIELRVPVLQLVCFDLRVAQERLFDLAQKSLKLRTIDFLQFLKEKFGLDKYNMIDIALEREDLAQSLGCTLQSIIRILSELRRENAIVIQGRKIGILLSPKSL